MNLYMGTYIQLHRPTQEKNIFLISFCSPSYAASILKNLKIDAVLEPENVLNKMKIIIIEFFI